MIRHDTTMDQIIYELDTPIYFIDQWSFNCVINVLLFLQKLIKAACEGSLEDLKLSITKGAALECRDKVSEDTYTI